VAVSATSAKYTHAGKNGNTQKVSSLSLWSKYTFCPGDICTFNSFNQFCISSKKMEIKFYLVQLKKVAVIISAVF
jgi:hypothetical protein